MSSDAPAPGTPAPGKPAVPSGEGRRALEAAFAAGRAAHPRIPLAFDAFAPRAWALATRRAGDAVAAKAEARAVAAVRGCAAADLFLATACEADVAAAWDALSAELLPRLRAFARSRGLPEGEADAVATEVLGDLPQPVSWAPTRTLVGTFDGSGTLFAWAAVLLLRRISQAARSPWRKRRSAEAPEDVADRGDAASPSPEEVLADAETSARFQRAFERAWARLSPTEQAAVAFKHRDGLSQRTIAAILGVGEAWVSRLLSRAVQALADDVRAEVDAAPAPRGGVPAFRALEEALVRSWARIAAPAPPTIERSPAERPDAAD